jgi:hypothetical protein
MVTMEAVEQQLKEIGFNPHAWGQAEVKELPHILLDHEKVFEVVNCTYEGGFALFVATNVRVLLIDKKPLNYLTVEDVRFDMINEIDYSHRIIGARISISVGPKILKVFSLNQQRLRKAIGHVQSCIANAKKQESDHASDQKEHLAQINQQLQSYMLAQHQQQQSLKEQLDQVQKGSKKADEIKIEEVKPSPELSDYLLAQSMLDKFRQDNTDQLNALAAAQKDDTSLKEAEEPKELPAHSEIADESLPPTPKPEAKAEPMAASPNREDLYAEGMKEIFGNRQQTTTQPPEYATPPAPASPQPATPAHPQPTRSAGPAKHKIFPGLHNPLEVNPLTIAYSKLPLALRNRKFGRPSFHAHSQQSDDAPQTAGAQQIQPAPGS